MSRTNHRTKGPGYDYWSRRANGEGKRLTSPSPYAKTRMNRGERHRVKQRLKVGE